MHSTDNNKLLSYVERIERLMTEKADIAQDIREVYSEAKSVGFDTKIMRKVIKLREKSTQERQEEAALVKSYAEAINLELFD